MEKVTPVDSQVSEPMDYMRWEERRSRFAVAVHVWWGFAAIASTLGLMYCVACIAGIQVPLKYYLGAGGIAVFCSMKDFGFGRLAQAYYRQSLDRCTQWMGPRALGAHIAAWMDEYERKREAGMPHLGAIDREHYLDQFRPKTLREKK